MVKAKDLKLLRKKIEKADRMDKSTIQKCIFGSTSVKNDAIPGGTLSAIRGFLVENQGLGKFSQRKNKANRSTR